MIFWPLALAAAALAQVAPAPLGPGRATTYAPGDGHCGATVGCPSWALRTHGTADLAELLEIGVPVVAHRSLPCGSVVLLGGCADAACSRVVGWALARVADRGPYGLDCTGQRRVATAAEARRAARDPAWAPPGCSWRGDWDLTPAIAEAVRLPGRGRQRRGSVLAWLLAAPTPSPTRRIAPDAAPTPRWLSLPREPASW